MARYRQVKGDDGVYRLVEVGDRRSHGVSFLVKGDFDAFKSPVDGSIISTQRDLDEHNRKHNVVNAQEFSDNWYAEKAAERARHYQGDLTSAERQRRGEEIHRIIERYERG